jgi:hypothetical protein
MRKFIEKNKKSIASLSICLLIAAVTMSFDYMHYGPRLQYDSIDGVPDTIPGKNESKENLNMKEYDEQMKNMDKEIQN